MSHRSKREAAERRVEQLEAALRPLANPYSFGEPIDPPPDLEIDCCVTITYSDVARARAALDSSSSQPAQGDERE